MNIAKESIKRSKIIIFICLIIFAAGIYSYFKIGKLEDPTYTIKTAAVTVEYPGASAYETEQEVSRKIETALSSLEEADVVYSRSTPGEADVYIDIKETYDSRELPQIWDKVRSRIDDIKSELPDGAEVYVDTDYGDVYGQYYALTGEGFSMKELWDYADFLKRNLVLVPGVSKIEIIGKQEEAVFIEFSVSRLSSLGISISEIGEILNKQNTLSEIGNIKLNDRSVRISPTSNIVTVEDIGALIIGGTGEKTTRLSDVAKIYRDYSASQYLKIKYNDKPALAIGISAVKGGNILEMAEAISEKLKELEASQPIGIELHEIYLQSKQVDSSVKNFIVNLMESLAVVIGVLLVFMGLRSGIIIGLVLLLTVFGTLIIMQWLGIYLQIVSLASLVLALGSLVDNAIVVTEGMLVGVEMGKNILEAASEAVENSKWAMLGGTLIAILAFFPIGFSTDGTGEFCFSLVQVVCISMTLSWIFALTITPVLGKLLLKADADDDYDDEGQTDPYDKFLFRAYRKILMFCLKYKFLTIFMTAIIFSLSLYIFGNVNSSFMPDSEAAYFNVDLWAKEGSNLDFQESMTQELCDYLKTQPEVKNITQFIGGGGLRFLLTYTPPETDSASSQLIVEINSAKECESIIRKTQNFINEKMPYCEGGAVPYSRATDMEPKISACFSGEDPKVLRELAEEARRIMEDDYAHNFVRIDWREPVEVIRPVILKNQMRKLGLSRSEINQALSTATTGLTIGCFRERDEIIPIKAVISPEERNKIDYLSVLPIWSPAAEETIPLGTLVENFETVFEDNIISRKHQRRVIKVNTDLKFGENTDLVFERIAPKIEAIELPAGYSLNWEGEVESSGDAMTEMLENFLPTVIAIFMIMIFLFNGFLQPLIIFISLPLILTGAALGLKISGMDFSFMAAIGLLSLVGMLAKNSIVLLDQVSVDFEAGRDKYQTILENGVARLRPVSMSALTTVLGMFPLVWDTLFGPMAVTIMGGLTVSTVLTLIFIPVVTGAVYKVH